MAGGGGWLISANSTLTAVGVLLGWALLSLAPMRTSAPFRLIAWTALVGAAFGRVGAGLVPGGLLLGGCLLMRNALIPLTNAANDVIWQKEVAGPFQGRALGARRFFAPGVIPVGMLLGTSLVGMGLPISVLFVIGGGLEVLLAVVLLADHSTSFHLSGEVALPKRSR